MELKAFIGGYGGCGSRLVVNIFEKLGYYTAKEFSNPFGDFGWGKFVEYFDKGFENKNYSELFEFIDSHLNHGLKHDTFIIKHGHFMFIPNEIRARYPEAKLIYVDRNIRDTAAKLEYIPHFKYGGIPIDDFSGKMRFYSENAKIAIENSDLVISYENLCFNPKDEIKKIENFCNLKPTITNYDFIVPSKNIS